MTTPTTNTPTTTSSLRYAELAQALSTAARDLDMIVPGFRAPAPGGPDSSIRENNDGSFDVLTRIKGRPWEAVAVDMIGGVLAVNGISGHAQREVWREALYASVGHFAPSDADGGDV